MLNSLDLLVIVAMVLAAVSLMVVCLMFLVHRPLIRKVCLYIASALGLLAGVFSMQMFWFAFPMQFALGIVLGALGIAAIVLERSAQDNEKKLMLARVCAALSLVGGMLNLFS